MIQKAKLIIPVLLLSAAIVTCLHQRSTADSVPPGSAAVTVTSANIQEILNSEFPVLIDFWASWCGPCREIAPIIEELAAEYEGRVLIGKVNVDQEPALAAQFGIRGIPNLKILEGGKVVDEILGSVPKSEITKKLDRRL